MRLLLVVLVVGLAACEERPVPGAPEAGGEARGMLVLPEVGTRDPDRPAAWTDEVAGFRAPLPSGFLPRLEFENPPTAEAFVILRRWIAQGPSRGEIVVDAWRNPGRLSVDGWLDRFGDFALYSNGVPTGREAVGRAGIEARWFRTRGGQSPDKDLVVFAAGERVFRVMYVSSDGGASQRAFQLVVSGFEVLP